ncbi:MAG: argininosuccinate lyase [Deltaproteobacteria bacterium]|nr:argininosuccinate lyase [Deltaproteobacteria bacterium]
MSKKVWGGRFEEEMDAFVDQFNASLSFDQRLYSYDIKGSMAHCRMLAKQGILKDEEAAKIIEGLQEIERDLDRGEFPWDDSQEDIHSLIETALVDRVGEVGEKLHIGRSRNDQVALDVRLFLRDCIKNVIQRTEDLQRALIVLAEENIDVMLPGYTHLQRAQPVLLAHHLMAYFEMLGRDKGRLQECGRRVNIMPLGSAALAGPSFDLDRHMVAGDLEFDAITANSMDAVSDRDFVLEFLFISSVLMMHLSRLSEELVLWSTQEFGFVTLPDAFCTGSSIMPQKKNPDLPELVRGKTGRVYGHLVSVLTMMKGLPLAYNKDMQEDKEALFDTVDTVENCLIVLNRLLSDVRFNRENMKRAVEKGYLVATDLADYLVTKGMTFRKAHETVGKMVLHAMDHQKELDALSITEMRRFSEMIEDDVMGWLEPLNCIRRRRVPGATGSERVRENLEKAKKELGDG